MNKRNSQNLIFKLGDERVNERVNYDHVGVRVCLYDDDVSGLEERVSKARRAFYAISGLGIRHCGLNMYMYMYMYPLVHCCSNSHVRM